MEEIIDIDDIGESLLVTLRQKETGDRKEAVIVRRKDEFKCWLNYCKHITTINIQKGEEAPIREDEIVCENHGAMFNLDSGICTFGPCKGAVLDEVDVVTESGSIMLTDEKYTFLETGGIENDNLSSNTKGEYSF